MSNYGARPAPDFYPPAHNSNAAAQSYGSDYASSDRFASRDFVGLDTSGARPRDARDSYPPPRSEKDYGQEKGGMPVTRGSIAAQMAAEGQIPKKEGLRMWRTDEHAGALMKGGRGRCCGRVCGCSLILVLIILVSVIAAFFLWTRPPDITFNGIEAPLNGEEVGVQPNGFILNFGLNIGVINPNYFGAFFNQIKATATYVTAPNVPFGGGTLTDVEIPKNSNTTIHFPFMINYTTTIDPDLSILKNIAVRCGYLNSTTVQALKVDYTIQLTLKVLAVTINPSFSSSATFPCPLTESDVDSLLGSAGLAQRTTAQKRDLIINGNRALEKVATKGWQTIAERGAVANLGGVRLW